MRLDQVEAWKRKGWTVEPLYAQPPAVAVLQEAAKDSLTVHMEAPSTEYSWSDNGEEYHGRFDSIEEAVCDYLDTYGEDAAKTVHVGEVKPYKPETPYGWPTKFWRYLASRRMTRLASAQEIGRNFLPKSASSWAR